MRLARNKTAVLALGLAALLAQPALAQTSGPQNLDPSPNSLNGGTPILFPSSSSSYNQQGFNLPSAPRATGQDIVRGAGGISCQSAIGSGGPSLDVGVIGTNDIYSRESAAMYGRVTIPLGKRPKRVDCTRLFELEVERLKMELEMMRAVQTESARIAAAPVLYEDAAPLQPFSIGDLAQAITGAESPEPVAPSGFILGGDPTASQAPTVEDTPPS